MDDVINYSKSGKGRVSYFSLYVLPYVYTYMPLFKNISVRANEQKGLQRKNVNCVLWW